MTQKRATIYDVADMAGVSHQTVSRYLRNNGGLKPVTLARVEAAVETLNYRPNLIARSMRTRQTGRMAILLPSATVGLPLRLMSAATATAHAAGYTIDVLSLEGAAAERIAHARELAESGEFEGILTLASLGDEPLSTLTTSIVVVSNYDDEMRGVGALADGTACGEVVRILVQLGHRQFLHLAGPQSYASARNRRQTFLESTDRLGVTGSVIDGDWSGAFGHDAIAALPADTEITAVVTGNDLVAMGAIRASLGRGWAIPEDLSVFGWNDEDFCQFTSPSLSTVAIDRERQGREAMERLINSVRGAEQAPPAPTSLHTVITRESIGPAPADRRPRRAPAPR